MRNTGGGVGIAITGTMLARQGAAASSRPRRVGVA
jgi:hypothetical protein